ncbi:hypothetical protein ATPR_3501 [Acetobacter tropicalis NBRC 101654]|uniref:Uncharacterized protein n=1 Tax=Acetobacter tropicalis NBRC 101654 TaxID=749388 RepID=F7VJF2_9PROT|nr:hypothetical protein ATPR_3501 [Acetobacter tropicalis NBRC 101654]
MHKLEAAPATPSVQNSLILRTTQDPKRRIVVELVNKKKIAKKQ